MQSAEPVALPADIYVYFEAALVRIAFFRVLSSQIVENIFVLYPVFIHSCSVHHERIHPAATSTADAVTTTATTAAATAAAESTETAEPDTAAAATVFAEAWARGFGETMLLRNI